MSASLAAPPRLRRRIATPALLGIVNANATGTARGLAVDLASAVRRAGGSIDVVETGSIDELTAALARAYDRRVLLVGGDGTVHAVANAPALPAEIALLPRGSANNVARSLNIPLDPSKATRLALAGQVRPIDLVEAYTPTRRYVTVESLSVGFLARARVRYQGRNSGDTLQALKAGAAALAEFHPSRVRVTRDGVAKEIQLGQLFVANLPLYEFGLHVAPHANPTDEQLDFVGVEASGRPEIGLMLARLLRGSATQSPGVHLWRAACGRIVAHDGSPIVADSENLGPGPVRLAVWPRALPIVRP